MAALMRPPLYCRSLLISFLRSGFEPPMRAMFCATVKKLFTLTRCEALGHSETLFASNAKLLLSPVAYMWIVTVRELSYNNLNM